MDHQQHGPRPDPIEAVVAAMSALGEATAAAIATQAGFAYSTVTPKLRALEDNGRAERVRTNGHTRWRLTPATPATDNDSTPDDPDGEPELPGSDQTSGDGHANDGDHANDSDGGGATGPGGTEQPTAEQPTAAVAGADNSATSRAGEPAPDDADAPDEQVAAANGPAAPRRGKGALRDAVAAVLQDHPDTAFKVGEVSRLLDGASHGAIANALHKLVTDGTARQTVEKPATFQAN